MSINIVLVNPEIPNNTGNIGRLCLATNSVLHIVKPYSFEISDKQLQRAGLDYWKHLKYFEYESYEDFLSQHGDKKLYYYTKNAEKSIWETEFNDNDFFLFGRESKGIQEEYLEGKDDSLVKIPMFNDKVRSLNLANSVAISIYTALEKIHGK